MSHSSAAVTNEELVLRIQHGEDVNDNLQELYDQNTGMIHKFIKPYLVYSEEDDLMQEAFFGLWDAAKRYDPDAGTKFITYAIFWIRLHVSRYCKSNCNLKRIPEHYMQRIRSYEKYIKQYFAEHQRYPSAEEISNALSISTQKVEELQRVICEADSISLDEAVPGTEMTVKDTIADDNNLEDQIVAEANRAALWKIVDSLESPMCTVIDGYYHLNIPMKQLSKICGLSQTTVTQIKKDAIRILRKKEVIRELAIENGYQTSAVYHGSLASFRNSGMSVVERIAIRNMTMEEQKKKIIGDLANIKMAYQKGKTDDNK